MFGSPMWDSESERIGLRLCTPVGYGLHVVSDVMGLLSLLLLVGLVFVLVVRGIGGTLKGDMLWLLAAPLATALAGRLVHAGAWALARRRHFRYDGATREARWLEDGLERRYAWRPGA